MYLKFYGLDEKPFSETPDPRYLFLSPPHREALAQLQYCAEERKGFVVLTGEIGTGKTTLLNTLYRRLDPKTAVAFIVNSRLPFDGLLECILDGLGVAKREESLARRLIVLQTFLTERERAGQNTVLIIDEAQSLSPMTLEQIRLLSNFETTRRKLLQILLVGQPELEAKLNLPQLRQLRQRLGLRCRIRPLTGTEAGQYIRTRLRVAGSRDLGVFTEAAVARMATYSRGVPRVLNILGDHCLLFGYAEQRRRVERELVEQAIEYLEASARARRGWTIPGLGALRRLPRLVGSAVVLVGAAASHGLVIR